MKKMDMIWIVVADMLHSSADATNLISAKEIEKEIKEKYNTKITPVMYQVHLVSWQDRSSSKKDDKVGGSKNRYLFRTEDGLTPSKKGNFRLYKQSDGKFDGKDKEGKVCPDADDVPDEYRYLITWYREVYYPSE